MSNENKDQPKANATPAAPQIKVHAPMADQDEGDALAAIDEDETPVLRFECVRELGGAALYPQKDQDGLAWLLPYSPAGGVDYALGPGGRAFLETGLKVQVPEGYVLRVSHPISRGKPGMLVPTIEFDSRYDHEMAIPVRNDNGRDPIIVYPGDYFFSARLYRSEEFESLAHKVPKFDDVGGRPVKRK